MLYIGLFIGLISIIFKLKSVQYDKFFFLGLAGACLTLIASYPPIYSHFSRVSKDFIRFYDGLFIGIILAISFKININVGVASIVLFLLFKNLYNKKRSGDRICSGCPELEKGTTCSGFIEQKQAFLELDEEYSKIITESMAKRKDFKQ